MALLPEVKSHYGKLKLLIDGEWVDSTSTQVHETVNPATGEVIAEFPTATKEEATGCGGSGPTGLRSYEENPLTRASQDAFRHAPEIRGAF